MRNATLRQLRSVLAVARRGSIAHAARELFLTGPAVTLQIRQLEEEVGLALFDRTSTGMIPTEAGRVVIDVATQVEGLLLECRDRLDAFKGLEAGRVAIGVVSTAKYFGPRAIAAFTRLHPGIDISLLVGNRQEILAALREHRVDVVMMGRPPSEIELVHGLLGDHPLVVIASPDHPLAARQAIPSEDLRGEAFLLRETGSGTRMAFEAFLAGAPGLSATLRFTEMGSNETIKQAVMAGLGIAFLSGHTVEAEVESGRLAILDVQGTPVMRQWFVIRRADRTPSPSAAAFERFLTAHAAEFLPSIDRLLRRPRDRAGTIGPAAGSTRARPARPGAARSQGDDSMSTPDREKPRGENSVLGGTDQFGKHETAKDRGTEERAKDELGHMGEHSPQTGKDSPQT